MSKPRSRSQEFDPKGFGQFNSDDPTVMSLNPWRQLGRHAMMFQVAVAGDTAPKKPQFADDAMETINRRCDEFIEAFVNSNDRREMLAPIELRGYLTLRAIKACLICKNNEETGVPAPLFYKENFRNEILELLIDSWYADRYDNIPGWSQPPETKRLSPKGA